jgi:hypothetical protein
VSHTAATAVQYRGFEAATPPSGEQMRPDRSAHARAPCDSHCIPDPIETANHGRVDGCASPSERHPPSTSHLHSSTTPHVIARALLGDRSLALRPLLLAGLWTCTGCPYTNCQLMTFTCTQLRGHGSVLTTCRPHSGSMLQPFPAVMWRGSIIIACTKSDMSACPALRLA